MTHQTETAITNSLLKNPNYFNLTTNQTVDLTTEITQFKKIRLSLDTLSTSERTWDREPDFLDESKK